MTYYDILIKRIANLEKDVDKLSNRETDNNANRTSQKEREKRKPQLERLETRIERTLSSLGELKSRCRKQRDEIEGLQKRIIDIEHEKEDRKNVYSSRDDSKERKCKSRNYEEKPNSRDVKLVIAILAAIFLIGVFVGYGFGIAADFKEYHGTREHRADTTVRTDPNN